MRAAIRNLRAAGTRPRTGMLIALAAGVLLLAVVAVAKWMASPPAEPSLAAAPAAQPRFGSAEPPPTPITPMARVAPEPLPPPRAPTAIGDRLADEGGPELLLARAAKGSRPALAVMAAPVDAALYQRYSKDRGRKPVTCADSPMPAQGCLDLAAANDMARWLSKQTGQRYRVPTRDELGASIAQVATTPAYAWTSTCKEVRVARSRNAAQRGWAKLRKAVGKPKPVQYDVRCDGHYTLKLDGRGDAARARDRATPETVVVLVRAVAESEATTLVR